MSTVKDALRKALWLCGAVGQGQTPQAFLMAEALSSLNMMLDMWSSSPQAIYINSRETFSLTVEKKEYSIGVGGDFNTARPTTIFDSLLAVGSTEYPLKIILRSQYDAISNPNIVGQPRVAYYEPTSPLGTLRFYPVPNGEYTFTMISLKPLPQYELNDNITLPQGYLTAIVYGLAVFMGPGIGKQLRAEVVSIAQKAYDNITINNYVNQIQPISTNPIYGSGEGPVFHSGFTYSFPFTVD
jgi:hypothetical protein